eukprot:TRINITY_DN3673_c0_g2_i11.p1 TRINITY_DN3673_c0_g2~~TRINITY_DN3673_c0_g2_i11.p1  ORF type:complete len:162 (-),score=19.72 TRINITY_DN3673_c0_g2_i11:632-1117(-)
MGFVYGIRRAPFPLIISVRYADEKFLVFDDLLKLTSCHLNAIPTDVYCPDWRYLLLNPPKGLELINSLRRVAWEVVKTQFLTNLSWKKKFFKNYESLTEGNFEELISYGMNYPPSQSQLHLQVIMLPFLPFRCYLHNKNSGAMVKRFFPLSYLTASTFLFN